MSKLGRLPKYVPPWDKMSRWLREPRSRLPEHYKQRRIELEQRVPLAVHYEPDTRKFKLDGWGQRQQVQNFPIDVVYPKQANEGLWGGEGIIKGFMKRNPIRAKHPHVWKPSLMRRPVYSEILDKYFQTTVTRRTLELIDKHYGLDSYILSTHEQDLKSRFGMELKKEMLRTLSQQSMYPNNPEKRQKIYQKYKKFLIPEEEIEWLGLTEEEAIEKMKGIEAELNKPRPLKYQYTQELIEKLKVSKEDGTLEEEEGGMVKKLSEWNPFVMEKDPKNKQS